MRGTVTNRAKPSPERRAMLHRCGVEPVPLDGKATVKVVCRQRCAYRALSGTWSARCRKHATRQLANATSQCAVRHIRNVANIVPFYWFRSTPPSSSVADFGVCAVLALQSKEGYTQLMVDHMQMRMAEPSDVEVLVQFNCAMANVSIYATSWVSSPCFVYHQALAKLTHQHFSLYAGDGRYQPEP